MVHKIDDAIRRRFFDDELQEVVKVHGDFSELVVALFLDPREHGKGHECLAIVNDIAIYLGVFQRLFDSFINSTIGAWQLCTEWQWF
ncbi:hypothetical protein SDC9_150618 [bioreactor metagenome]|uniref:Uncharacterized protein n=1 Tax=bioreactor metagenome TaxID=1076179 RepID=A0A645EMY9_9ZZZZ